MHEAVMSITDDATTNIEATAKKKRQMQSLRPQPDEAVRIRDKSSGPVKRLAVLRLRQELVMLEG